MKAVTVLLTVDPGPLDEAAVTSTLTETLRGQHLGTFPNVVIVDDATVVNIGDAD